MTPNKIPTINMPINMQIINYAQKPNDLLYFSHKTLYDGITIVMQNFRFCFCIPYFLTKDFSWMLCVFVKL